MNWKIAQTLLILMSLIGCGQGVDSNSRRADLWSCEIAKDLEARGAFVALTPNEKFEARERIAQTLFDKLSSLDGVATNGLVVTPCMF